MLDGMDVAWAAATTACGRAGGTTRGDTTWQVVAAHTVLTQVSLKDASFSTSDPAVVVSLSCKKEGRCWNTAGGNVAYAISSNRLLVYVYAPELDIHYGLTSGSVSLLNEWGWSINWIGTENMRRGGQGDLIEATKWTSNEFEMHVDTSAAGFSSPPEYFFSPRCHGLDPGLLLDLYSSNTIYIF